MKILYTLGKAQFKHVEKKKLKIVNTFRDNEYSRLNCSLCL